MNDVPVFLALIPFALFVLAGVVFFFWSDFKKWRADRKFKEEWDNHLTDDDPADDA